MLVYVNKKKKEKIYLGLNDTRLGPLSIIVLPVVVAWFVIRGGG